MENNADTPQNHTQHTPQTHHSHAPEGSHNPRHRKKPSQITEAIRLVVVFGILYGLSFALVNAPAYAQRVAYWWKGDYTIDPNYLKQQTVTPTPETDSEELLVVATATPTPPLDISAQTALSIEKIGIRDVPIFWNVAADDVVPTLSNGIAHYQGTGIPGSREHRNVFITGHSSNWWWDKGQYNNIFALLDKLTPGDTVTIASANQKFVYKVRSTFSIDPTQTEVLKASDTPILTLMTCWPVGTNAKRWIVVADQIEPVVDLPALESSVIKPAPVDTVIQLFRTLLDRK